MIWPNWGNRDELVWEFPLFDAITDTDAPPNWTSALEAVARDLTSTSGTHRATLAHTSWELRMDADYVMPLQEGRMLRATVRDSMAVWVDPRTDTVVACIGELCDP